MLQLLVGERKQKENAGYIWVIGRPVVEHKEFKGVDGKRKKGRSGKCSHEGEGEGVVAGIMLLRPEEHIVNDLLHCSSLKTNEKNRTQVSPRQIRSWVVNGKGGNNPRKEPYRNKKGNYISSLCSAGDGANYKEGAN